MKYALKLVHLNSDHCPIDSAANEKYEITITAHY